MHLAKFNDLYLIHHFEVHIISPISEMWKLRQGEMNGSIFKVPEHLQLLLITIGLVSQYLLKQAISDIPKVS